MDFWGVLALSLPPLRILHHLRVERQCQGNLDIQPGINQRNQPEVCPSRAVAFQCPETSNRRKWRVISGVCWRYGEIWNEKYETYTSLMDKNVMDIISL